MHDDERASDTELAAAVARGDAAAFEQLVARYGTDVWNFATRWCADRQQVPDLVQEVWIKVWHGAAGFRGDARLRTWLFAIVHRTGVDFARHDERRPRTVALPDPDRTDADLGAIAGPEDGVAERDRLRRALALIPPGHRTAILLRHLLAMPYPEIAEVCGVSEANARSWVARGRVALTRLLAVPDTVESADVPAGRVPLS
ncbi:RNA polymerase sigma factor [Embleya hyalina]|uniref:DNA-directed RNA polymerase sigma-70 factor n=1 Tax=Embleya hyalina TaxID=516124 RepID=A0A401YMJ5_9ACTN|nr:RNA polymerase sigma factor [Embleya hyalina]GCD95815.1 DNA-directed RNA polymerase sigma-70 factor [Embleya hyalina]